MDVAWGILFVIPNLILLILVTQSNGRAILTFILVAIWAIRLAIHIGRRHNGEDFRYVEMRENWMKRGKGYYYFAAFTFVFTMQALFSLIVNASALFVMIYSTDGFFALDVIGAVIWAFGFIFEGVADH